MLVSLNFLKGLNYRINVNRVREAFAKVVEDTGLMGRWMKIADKPLMICDSAHNPPGMQQAMRQLKAEKYDKFHLVLGFMADKDVQSMLSMFPDDAIFHFTQAQTSRSMSATKLKQLAKAQGINGDTYNNVSDALQAVQAAAGPKDLIYVGGSMYILAELLKLMGYGD